MGTRWWSDFMSEAAAALAAEIASDSFPRAALAPRSAPAGRQEGRRTDG